MIPVKIETKIKEKCGNDNAAFEVIMDLLYYEDSGKGKQNINCRKVVEKYATEVINNED